MQRFRFVLLILAALLSGAPAAAQTAAAAPAAAVAPTPADRSLTLCWAAWDPADALVNLSKEFTTQTGVRMRYLFVPWTGFAYRMLKELSSKSDVCDLMIGDSQWMGTAATAGHYVELTDFFAKNGIDMKDFMPATVEGYSTWPKGSKHYWALPAMGDAVAWTYRKDWFARPDLRREFKNKYGRDLDPPDTWEELKEVAQFFQGREIDGKKVYGAAIYTERASEGITMGVTSAMYAWGMQYDNPAKPYDMGGFINSEGAVQGLKFYRELFDCCTPPEHFLAYMSENLNAYRSGRVAMQMNFIAFFPGIAKHPAVGGDKTGFFVMPRAKERAAQLGGQGISVVAYSPKRDLALQYIKWFAQPAVQTKWWELGGFSTHVAVTGAPGFADSTPYARVYLDSMRVVRDFWQEPVYEKLLGAMQVRVHDYVVAGRGTPQAALDKLLQDWTDIFKQDGKSSTAVAGRLSQ
ncbi:MAG TPA: ABC transporter substrate-binding protein [Burkholderiaceae bacterium]|nr:ABC transporter substrate-binding protein [Burkholderiaceae bacterium]